MSKLTFKDPHGRSLTVNSSDGSTPSESELDQMFAQKYGDSQQSSQPDQASQPQESDVEQRISSRQSAIADLTKNPTTAAHPLGAVLRTLGGAAELYQGAPASIAYDLQQGKPGNILKNLLKVATGQRPIQYGDVFKGAGVPEPLAAAGGLYADTVLSPGGAEAGIAGGKLIKQGISKLAEPMKALNDIGASLKDVGNSIKTVQNEFQAVSKEDIPRKIVDTIRKVRGSSSKQLEHLNNHIQGESEAVSQQMQKKLPEYFKNNSKIYGSRLDEISDNLAMSGKSITRGEFHQILDDVVSESQDEFLAAGKPMEEISYLKKKYAPSFETGSKDANTFAGMQKPRFNADDELNFKEVVSDIKKAKNALSSKVKLGYRYTPEDIVGAKLMSKWGDYIQKSVPEFSELNQEYKPVIAAMKMASKTFKPYASEFETKSGTQFLKNLSLGKLERGQQELLNFIEKGSENFPGIGNVTGGLKQLGSSKTIIEGLTDNSIKQLMDKKSQVQDLLSKESGLMKSQKEIKDKFKLYGKVGAALIGEETLGPKVIRKRIGL